MVDKAWHLEYTVAGHITSALGNRDVNAGVSLFSPFIQYGTPGPGMVSLVFSIGFPSAEPFWKHPSRY